MCTKTEKVTRNKIKRNSTLCGTIKAFGHIQHQKQAIQQRYTIVIFNPHLHISIYIFINKRRFKISHLQINCVSTYTQNGIYLHWSNKLIWSARLIYHRLMFNLVNSNRLDVYQSIRTSGQRQLKNAYRINYIFVIFFSSFFSLHLCFALKYVIWFLFMWIVFMWKLFVCLFVAVTSSYCVFLRCCCCCCTHFFFDYINDSAMLLKFK